MEAPSSFRWTAEGAWTANVCAVNAIRPSATEAGVALASAAVAFAYARTPGSSVAPAAVGLTIAMGLLGVLTARDRPDRQGLVRSVVACGLGVTVGSIGGSLLRTSLLVLVYALGRAGLMLRLERSLAAARAAAALAEERAQIARDLHDVISHSLGVVVVQVHAAEQVMDSDPGRAKEALRSAAAVGRDALDEMHRMVGVMRGGPDRKSAQPALDDLPALVAQTRSAGMSVELTVDEEAKTLPPGIQLAAFRIVQEALANAAHHAAGATAAVEVHRGSDALTIEVANTGGRARSGKEGGGYGLAGMRERAAVYRGTVEAGPRGGGFVVRARLPLKGLESA